MTAPAALFMAKTMVIHGPGAASSVGQHTAGQRVSKALIVTDKAIRAAGLLDGVEHSLSVAGVGYEVFDEVTADATVGLMHQGAVRAKEAGCNGVIVVGGGSAICAGRGTALEAANGERVTKYEGNNRYSHPPLPVICLPTTAGSGADVSVGFAVHDEVAERVFATRGDDIHAKVSILDPLLLLSCPPRQMIYSGLDALAHAVDAIWVKTATPLTDTLGYEAIRLIMASLRKAALTDDLGAKHLQHIGSTMASIACSNAGLGIDHGMTMYYGFKAPHACQAAMLLPYAMEFNLPACEDRLARMAIAIGEDPRGWTTRELAELAIQRVKELYLDLGFPRRFEEAEFPVNELPAMAKAAKENHFIQINMRKASEQDLLKLYEATLKGWGM